LTLLAGTALLVISGGLTRAQSTGTTTRVSVASDGTQANERSFEASISADGRYVAFESDASNLVSGDSINMYDVFVHDRQTGETSHVSVASDGTEGNLHSGFPSISADGRYVAFHSQANNLVPGDTNNTSTDVLVHDRQTGETTLVSVASDGTQGNRRALRPSISADGRYVAFESSASNLVPDDTNNAWDIFVHDRQTGETTRVSVASDGSQTNNVASGNASISADGRYVAFESGDRNLVPNDTNNSQDIFVHDRQTGETTRVSVASDGSQAYYGASHPSISADGRYVAFHSLSSNLVSGDTNAYDVFVHDRQTGETTLVSVASDGSQANQQSRNPSISADGRSVAFHAYASNLVPDDTNDDRDIFVHDRQTGETTLVSVASDGTQGNSFSRSPIISADGRSVAFESEASNLVPGDTNGPGVTGIDIFVHDRGTAPAQPTATATIEPDQPTATATTEPDQPTATATAGPGEPTPTAGPGDPTGSQRIFLPIIYNNPVIIVPYPVPASVSASPQSGR
jgi:Tol biopolymer transport system component